MVQGSTRRTDVADNEATSAKDIVSVCESQPYAEEAIFQTNIELFASVVDD